jgi:hypothetical protein
VFSGGQLTGQAGYEGIKDMQVATATRMACRTHASPAPSAPADMEEMSSSPARNASGIAKVEFTQHQRACGRVQHEHSRPSGPQGCSAASFTMRLSQEL